MLNNAIVIDDKESDGDAIARVLWSQGIGCLFFKYDADKLYDLKTAGNTKFKQNNVRVIFQDINLLGESTPSVTDYDAATDSIDFLLRDDNGPWIMAIWSTFQSEGSDPDYEKQLFVHLRTNLDDGKKPFTYVLLDKARYTIGSEAHGDVKGLSEDEVQGLREVINQKIDEYPNFKALSAWENNSRQSAQKVFHDLSLVSKNEDPNVFDYSLQYLLSEIGAAATSTYAEPELKQLGAHNSLNQTLSNELSASDNLFDFTASVPAEAPELVNSDKWKWKVNTVLHLEVAPKVKIDTGMIYGFKMPSHYYSASDDLLDNLSDHYSSDGILNKFFNRCSSCDKERDKPTSTKNQLKTIRSRSKEQSEVILVDITPPCDHAQNKSIWRKLCVGVEYNIALEASENDALYLCGCFDAVWKSPLFYIDDDGGSQGKAFLVDPKLIMHIPAHDDFLSNLDHKYCFKEELQRDLVHHVASHLSRPGITEMARPK